MQTVSSDCLSLILDFLKFSEIAKLKFVNRRFNEFIISKYQTQKIAYTIGKMWSSYVFTFELIPKEYTSDILLLENRKLWDKYDDPVAMFSDLIFFFDNRLYKRETMSIDFRLNKYELSFNIESNLFGFSHYPKKGIPYHIAAAFKDNEIEILKLLYTIIGKIEK